VQPPGHPQQARFFSGSNRSYLQAPRKFNFLWSPGEVEWQGDRGESHSYSVQKALENGSPDYTQCLPADMEIRMNLWNMFGTSRPPGVADHHVVEVVIDDFQYTPFGVDGLPEGAICSKPCQCESSSCIDNLCRRNRNLLPVMEDNRQGFGPIGSIRSFRTKEKVKAGKTIFVCVWLAAIAAVVLLLEAKARKFRKSQEKYRLQF
jgi:hypothetical protein